MIMACMRSSFLSSGVVDSDLDNWATTFEVNVLGVVKTIQAFVPELQASPQPSLMCTTASVGGVHTHAYTRIEREREREKKKERERARARERAREIEKEKERESERERATARARKTEPQIHASVQRAPSNRTRTLTLKRSRVACGSRAGHIVEHQVLFSDSVWHFALINRHGLLMCTHHIKLLVLIVVPMCVCMLQG